MESLISFDGFADVANNLIDKISNAIGWVITYETPKKVAISTYIEEIQNSNLEPLTKAAFISQAKKTLKEYCNQTNIVKMAISNISDSARPNDIDDDWLNQFMDKARLVSDSDFQIIWANILAEECNSPGTIPKALLHILEQMDKHVATEFMKVASVSVNYIDEGKTEYVPIILTRNFKDYYKSIGINLDVFIELESLGLIKTSEKNLLFSMECDSPVIAHYHDCEYHLPKQFCVGEVVYTRIGKVLCSVVKTEKLEGYFDKICVPLWQNENIEFNVI